MAGLTIGNPVTLSAALRSQRIIPGDSIELADGTYSGTFTVDPDALKGTAANPITIYAKNRGKVFIDGTLQTDGDYLILKDLVFTHNSWTSRDVAVFPSGQSNLYASAGSNTRLINCILHDGSEVIEAFGGSLVEVYGCLLYNGGLRESGTPAGHIIYTHDQSGTYKIFENNIWLASMNYAFHAHSSGANNIDNYHLKSNIFGKCNGKNCFGNDSGQAITVKRILFENNENLNTWWWFNRWTTPVGEDITIRNNYFDGSNVFANGCFQIKSMVTVTVTGNILAQDNGGLVILKCPDVPLAYTWDGNTYYGIGGDEFSAQLPGELVYTPYTFAGWQAATGYDPASTHNAYPPADRVVVLPNTYDAKICNVAIYNYTLADSVVVDVSAVYAAGDTVKVHQAQDYFNDIQTLVVSAGQTITIDMRAVVHTMVAPIGNGGVCLDQLMCPKYGAFMVEKT